jgi:hypothetical protein
MSDVESESDGPGTLRRLGPRVALGVLFVLAWWKLGCWGGLDGFRSDLSTALADLYGVLIGF